MKKFYIIIVSVILMICMFGVIFTSASTTDKDKNLFSKKDIKKDAEFLFDKLERIHPNLYFASSKEETQEKVKNILDNLDDLTSDLEFYKRIAPIISMLKDGHTLISPPNSYIENVQSRKNIIPIGVNISEGKIFIDNILSEEYFDKYKGCEILSINSKDEREIYEQIKNYVFGKNECFRNARISKEFILLYYLYNNFDDEYTLKLKDSNKTIINLKLKGISYSKYEGFSKIGINNFENEKYKYKVINKNIALMEVNSFTNFQGFKVFLENTFDDIKKNNIKELIIDLRKNSGGDATLGDLLVEYVYNGKYKRCGKFKLKVTEEILEHYKNNNWMNEEELNKLRGKVGKIHEEDKIQAYRNYKEKSVFNGDVYVLIGRNTYSAATMFASIVQDYHIGYLIGEETGGLATDYTNSYYFKLPNTNLSSGVSFQYIARPNGLDTGRGVLPEYYEKDIKKDALDIAIDIIKAKRD